MSKFLTQAAIQVFDDQVKHAYTDTQGGSLRKTVRLKTGVVGSSYQFPTMGKGIATVRIPQTDVIPMNVGYNKKTAVMTNWNAPEYTDIFDQQTTNVNEQKELAGVISGAMGRREDQLIIDALDAAATSLVVSTNIGGAGTGMSTAKARYAKALLDARGVPKSDRYALVHANAIYGLTGDTNVISSDYNATRALVDGEISRWLGFEWMTMEDRDEGGLPLLSGTVRKNFFYHGGPRGAIGLAVGIDRRTEINYIPEKTSWLANGLFSAGAVAIDPEGIVEVDTTDVVLT